jgi:hypothetical protein
MDVKDEAYLHEHCFKGVKAEALGDDTSESSETT